MDRDIGPARRAVRETWWDNDVLARFDVSQDILSTPEHYVMCYSGSPLKHPSNKRIFLKSIGEIDLREPERASSILNRRTLTVRSYLTI